MEMKGGAPIYSNMADAEWVNIISLENWPPITWASQELGREAPWHISSLKAYCVLGSIKMGQVPLTNESLPDLQMHSGTSIVLPFKKKKHIKTSAAVWPCSFKSVPYQKKTSGVSEHTSNSLTASI